MKDRQAMASRLFQFAAIAMQFLLLAGCVGPLRTQRPAVAVTNPMASASGLSWHSGVGPDDDPPEDCAIVPGAPKGTRSRGAVKGRTPVTFAYRTEHSVADPDDEINDNDLKSFEGPVTYALIPKNTVIYRVIGKGGNPIGKWWTNYPPPSREAEWRSQLAVLAEWNGASCVEKYKVSENGIPVWLGIAGPQNDGAKGWYLMGGGLQIFVPSPKSEIEKRGIEYAQISWAP